MFASLLKSMLMSSFLNLLCFLIGMVTWPACSENARGITSSENNEQSTSLKLDTLKFNSGVRSILHDSKGNYWMGSDQEGVACYNGKSMVYYNTSNGFCGKQVIAIKEDETGKIWFGTSSGLCYFDGNHFHSVDSKQGNPFLPDAVNATTDWKISPTDLWFPGNKSGELIRIEKGISYKIKNPVDVSRSGNPTDYGITGFAKDQKGGLWIACYDGVARYDGKDLQYIDNAFMGYDGKNKYLHVRSILADSKDRLWIGNNGIGVLLKEQNKISYFSEQHQLVKGDINKTKSPPGTLMHVFAMMEDSEGNIWFGDRDTGAWCFDGKSMKNYTLNPQLKTQHIWAIVEDKHGHLLFASADKGVYQFNGNGFDRLF